MLGVMEKYGPMSKLEHLRLSNLSMGSLLILLPFAPSLRTLSMKYREEDGASGDLAVPNLTDELFEKIFQKNKFQVYLVRLESNIAKDKILVSPRISQHLERLLIWCRTLSRPTAQW